MREDLRGENLRGENLRGDDLRRADLRHADLRRADLRGAELRHADLTDAELTGADLTEAELIGADLTDAELTGAELTEADLRRADLINAELTGADLRGAELFWADLPGADLRRADLRHADRFQADLPGADLTGADLTEADLSFADLTGADLTEADLRGADLSFADLTGAHMIGAKGVPSEQVEFGAKSIPWINVSLFNYTNIIVGFTFLAIAIVLATRFSDARGMILLSSGAFYATVGIYLFSQSNTIYSIGRDIVNIDLYNQGSKVSKAAALVAGGGAVHLIIAILIELPLHNVGFLDRLTSSQVEDLLSVVLISLAQLMILCGLNLHKKHHRWFMDLEKTLK